jgi:hypothetical protein
MRYLGNIWGFLGAAIPSFILVAEGAGVFREDGQWGVGIFVVRFRVAVRF